MFNLGELSHPNGIHLNLGDVLLLFDFRVACISGVVAVCIRFGLYFPRLFFTHCRCFVLVFLFANGDLENMTTLSMSLVFMAQGGYSALLLSVIIDCE